MHPKVCNDYTDGADSVSKESDRENSVNPCDYSSASPSLPTWFEDKGLKCACLNVNRLLCKLDLIKDCINVQLPNIFGLCETFLNNKTQDNILYHQGYRLKRRDRGDKGGGGLLCYISDGLHYKRREDLESAVCEIIWIEIVYFLRTFWLGLHIGHQIAGLTGWNYLIKTLIKFPMKVKKLFC